MAIDDPIALPKAPPPRPAARQAAIEAALRKFDGSEEATGKAVGERQGLFGWASTHRGPASALATAAVVAVIGIPIALATLRDLPRPEPQQPVASRALQPAQEVAADDLAAHEPAEDEANVAKVAEEEPAEQQPAAARQASPRPEPMALTVGQLKTANEEVAPAVTAAPPPAPPPPPAAPAPAPQRTRQYAAEPETQDMVVTGSRVRSADVSDRANRQAVPARPAPLLTEDSYGDFLSRLQSALKADNPRSVSRLVGFPLSVNVDGRVETYRSRREVERNFDRIFTPEVKSEILSQKPYSLRTRADGKTKGSERLWFAPACFNALCSPPGPIRIREVTP